MQDMSSPYDTPPFLALLLAAGEGSRLGKLPKSLLRVQNQTLLARQIQALTAANAQRIVVVTGYFHNDIEAELALLMVSFKNIHIVRHPEPDRGQQSSVTLGLQAMTEFSNHGPVLIALADQPLMQTTDFIDCIQFFYKRPAHTEIVVPFVRMQRGNPVVLSGHCVENVLASGLTCRAYIDQHPEKVHRFESNNDHYVFDIDAAKDLDQFKKRTGLTLTNIYKQ